MRVTPYNIESQNVANAEQTIRDSYDVSGSGITVLVADGGNVLETHQEFKDSTGTYTRLKNLLPLAQSPLDNHAAHIAGTIGARGINPNAKGFAPDCSLVTCEMHIVGIESNLPNYKTIVYNENVNVSNHSYGKNAGEYVTLKIFGTSSSNIEGAHDITVIKDWVVFKNIQKTAQLNEFLLMGKYTTDTSNIDYILNDVSDTLSVWAAGNARSDNFISLGSFSFKTKSGVNTTTIPFGSETIYIGKNAGATLDDPICILNSDYSEAYLYGTEVESGTGLRFFLADSDINELPGTKYYLPDGNTSNGGYDSISPWSVAKNSLVVGSVGRPDSNVINVDPRNITLGMSTLSLFSSTGPTDDGRIKPDLVADGSGVFSTLNTSNTAYGVYGGTSMAAPAVTGSAALVHEYYRKTIGNQSYRMPSATLKAILLANAYRGNAPPNYATGYGIVDVSKSLGFLKKWNNNNFSNANHVFLNESLFTGGKNTIAIYPKATDVSVNILICWNDYQPSTHPIINESVVDASHSVITNKLVIECVDTVTQTKYYPWYLNINDPVKTARNAVATGEKDAVWGIPAAHDNTKLIEFTPKNTNMHTVSVKMYNNVAVEPSVAVGQKYTLLVENAMSGQTINLNVDYIGVIGVSSPFYRFYRADNGLEVTEFIRGNKYVFTMRTVSSSHPFFVGADGYKSSTSYVTNVTSDKNFNNGLNEINDTLTLSIPTDYTGVFSYFCTSHTNMYKVMTLTSPTASALGDPYIYPYFGTKSGLPVKLPDLDAYYTMYQSADVSVYAHVKQATREHKQRMIEYVEMLKATNCVSSDILVTSVETDGFFFREVYVVKKGIEPLYIDLHEERGKAQEKKVYKTEQFCEPCQYMCIPLNECLFLNIMFFENPHLENGMELVGDIPQNATGILVREDESFGGFEELWHYHTDSERPLIRDVCVF